MAPPPPLSSPSPPGSIAADRREPTEVADVQPADAEQPGAERSAKEWPEGARQLKVCGTEWQDMYAALHSRIVAEATGPAAKPARIAVFDCRVGNGGLADRLTGLMTVLLIAILTDRALVLNWPGHEAALTSPRLDLTSLLPHASRADPAESRQVRWLNGNRVKLHAQLESRPLDELWPERVLVFQSNRGFTQQLLAGRLWDAAAERGITSENAQFGCLFNFLLRPTAEALAPYGGLADALGDGGRYTVGLHVRTGDATWDAERGAAGDAALLSRGAELYAKHAFMFEYAARLVDARPDTTLRPALLLLGDSKALRRYAAERHGDILLENNNGTVGHIVRQAVGPHRRRHSCRSRATRERTRSALAFPPPPASPRLPAFHSRLRAPSHSQGALQSAVAEHWLYGAADVFAYSSHSGFPRTAAARALRQDVIHTCFHYEGPLFSEQQGKPRPARECSGPWSVYELGERHAAGL